MRNLPVHWAEGMFLRPHQFQAADRYWSETLTASEHWDHQYNYGLRSIELSKEAVHNAQFEVQGLRARLKDGTLVSLEPGQEPDRVDLRESIQTLKTALTEAFQHETVVRIYLGVPKLKLGRANVAVGPEANGQARFVETTSPVQDESFGGNDQEIQLRRLNVRLLLSTQDLSGYELLPIAQVKRAGDKEAAPQLDDDYIPPVLAVDAWPELSRDIVRAIYDIIGQKIELLSSNVADRGISFSSLEAGDVERLMMLHELNAAYATLHVMAFAQGVHPLTMYAELVRIVGRLSAFQKPHRRVTDEIPRYDHDDLARIYKWVKKKIEELVAQFGGYQYEQRYFVGAGKGMQVTLEEKWLHDTWSWFVGVKPQDIGDKECMLMLSPGVLDWKIGSASQVDFLFKVRAEGLELTPLKQAPRALPTGGGWIYYEVTKGKAEWANVVNDRSLGLRVKEEMIQNLDTLAGQRDLVVATRNKRAVLQFCLFAVPKHQ